MHIAALIGRLRESLAQCRPEAGVIVGDDKLDAVETARLQPSSVIAFTFRVDTPCTYISASAATSARSER